MYGETRWSEWWFEKFGWCMDNLFLPVMALGFAGLIGLGGYAIYEHFTDKDPWRCDIRVRVGSHTMVSMAGKTPIVTVVPDYRCVLSSAPMKDGLHVSDGQTEIVLTAPLAPR